MRKLIFAIILMLFSMSPNASELPVVGKQITGKHLNQFSIRVGLANDSKSEWIYFFGKNHKGLLSTVRVENYKTLIEETMGTLRNAATKSLEWAKIAKQNNANVTKPLGCLSHNLKGVLNKICAKAGIASSENHIGFRFVSENNGKDTYLIINMADFDNQFITSSIYLTPKQIKQFLKNVNLIEFTFETKVRVAKENKKLFQ